MLERSYCQFLQDHPAVRGAPKAKGTLLFVLNELFYIIISQEALRTGERALDRESHKLRSCSPPEVWVALGAHLENKSPTRE